MGSFEFTGKFRREDYLQGHVGELAAPALRDVANEIADSADRALQAHRHKPGSQISGGSRIEVEGPVKGGDAEGGSSTNTELDFLASLVDPEGNAGSIEWGRAGYEDPDTGETWGAMEPTYVMTRAAGLPRRKVFSRRKRTRKRGDG